MSLCVSAVVCPGVLCCQRYRPGRGSGLARWPDPKTLGVDATLRCSALFWFLLNLQTRQAVCCALSRASESRRNMKDPFDHDDVHATLEESERSFWMSIKLLLMWKTSGPIKHCSVCSVLYRGSTKQTVMCFYCKTRSFTMKMMCGEELINAKSDNHHHNLMIVTKNQKYIILFNKYLMIPMLGIIIQVDYFLWEATLTALIVFSSVWNWFFTMDANIVNLSSVILHLR